MSDTAKAYAGAARSAARFAEIIIALTQERQRLRDALRDLLAMWDRRDDSGWTAADAARLEEIRKLVGA